MRGLLAPPEGRFRIRSRAVVESHDLVNQAEAQARAFFAGIRPLQGIKPLKDLVQRIGRDAGAGIIDA